MVDHELKITVELRLQFVNLSCSASCMCFKTICFFLRHGSLWHTWTKRQGTLKMLL